MLLRRLVRYCTSSSKGGEDFLRPLPRHHVNTSFLVNNYTAPVLAAAFQDREKTLQICCSLLEQNKLNELAEVLEPFKQQQTNLPDPLEIDKAFTDRHLNLISKRLFRLPRQIARATPRRASVVIPLCHVDGQPSVLFTQRSNSVGKHKGEVCFPGGMVDATDTSIIETCLREMKEEIGLDQSQVQVLGILRCDWSKVASLTGIAVTPVVGYVGEIQNATMQINQDEVDDCFTVPLEALVDRSYWTVRDYAAPVFIFGKHVIWGLTGYVLDNCLRHVVLPIR